MSPLPHARCPRRHRASRLGRLGALVVAVLAVAAVAGCSTIEAFTDLTGALRAEGFTDVEATVGGGDPVVLVVKADAPPGSTTDEALDEATEIVWTTFPRRFDVLQLTVDGEGRRLDYAEIEADLGARPARLDETDLTDEVTRLSLGIENFDDHILEINGRAHRSPEVFTAFERARAEKFAQINVDLIAGMLEETEANWQRNIEQTIALRPDSVTALCARMPE